MNTDTDKFKEGCVDVLRIYAITLIIPIALSLVNIVFCGILGFPCKYGFLMNFKILWIDYYFTGSLMDIVAWKWQLALLFCSFLIAKLA